MSERTHGDLFGGDLSPRAEQLHERDLVELLGRLAPEPLERLVQRLQQADLLTLARFPSQPHELVHEAVSSLHTVLLSMSMAHEAANVLKLTPWPLLRLDLLANIDAIWRKMWKRLTKLRRPKSDPRRKPLANAQIRFVLRHVLVPALTASRLKHSVSNSDSLTAVFARVSSIAQAVAAYVLLCAHNSIVPPAQAIPPTKGLVLGLSSISPPKLHKLQHIISSPQGGAVVSSVSTPSRSWRCGRKHQGRFFLFRAAVSDRSRANAVEQDTVPGFMSVLALDRHHAASQWEQLVTDRRRVDVSLDSLYALAWTKRLTVPPALVPLLPNQSDGSDDSPFMSIFIQAAIQMELFASPAPGVLRSHPFARYAPPLQGRFSLHVVELTLSGSHKHETSSKLTSIGLVSLFDQTTSLADLRVHFVACGSSTRAAVDPSPQSFRFFLRGALVPFEEEPLRRAIELLPLAIVCRSHSTISEHCWLACVSSLSSLHRSLVPPLCRHVTPPPPPPTSPSSLRLEACIYPMNQPVSRDSIDALLSIFLDWSTFVQFQQLQGSTTILYEDGSPHKRKLPPPIKDWITETEQRLRPEPTSEELELQSLPRTRFNPENAYLEPIYATLAVKSSTKGVLTSPFLDDVVAALGAASELNPIRIAVENEECVLHVTAARLRKNTATKKRPRGIVIHLTRDASCPLEMLLTMRVAYVWLIKPLLHLSDDNHSRKKPLSHSSPSQVPPRWLRDVLRFVVHPTLDFSVSDSSSLSYWPYPSRFHRVRVPHSIIENLVEATFWSRSIDWHKHWRACDVEADLLRPLFEKLCHSFPVAFALDGVKFSKFLRECGLQPAFLTIGDAAFLFTNNRAPGSHYEMIYEGFANALRWIVRRAYRHRHSEGDDDAAETELLHSLCFEWLLRAPSISEIWRELVHSWRLHEKLQYMRTAAIQYCAATRIQANWRRLVTRRVLIDVLTRLKNERRAAAKVQSVYKMRKQRTAFLKLRRCAVRTQLFIRARRVLRLLRVERQQLVERMRGRLQKWMRQRLRVLRCWKKLNADWLARRGRILEKRSRLVWAGAYQLESRLYRVSLYRSPVATDAASNEVTSYELEILEPKLSQWRSIEVSTETLELLEEQAQGTLGASKPSHARYRNRWKLLVLMQRLHFKRVRDVATSETVREPKETLLQIYRDPMDSSLGRLLFQGPVSDHFSQNGDHSGLPFVRLLLRSFDLTLLTYSTRSSTKQRFTFTTAFVYRVFQVTHWRGLTLPSTSEDSAVDGKDVTMPEHSFVVTALTIETDRLLAMRVLLEYVIRHGTKWPTRDMLPEEIAKREADRHAQAELVRQQTQRRELALVVSTQANARRLLAIRYVQRLARMSYIKCFNRGLGRFVYKHRREHDELLYTTKPHSLRDLDVPGPSDEWIPAGEQLFFNPLRGVFSRINDHEAAVKLQRWYRKLMWACGVPAYNLRSLSQSLLFHNNVRAPVDVSDPRELGHITHFALQRHLIHHDYKAALTLYEAALKIAPDHVPALIGLAVLLIFTCRYPVKQTWPRALELLETARHSLNGDLETAVPDIEQSCFRWAMFLEPKNPHAIGNFAVFLQCVRGDLDRAELLYRRAIDLDPSNEWIVENYLRLQRERTPEGIYKAAGPSKTSAYKARQVARVDGSDWHEMEDIGARFPSAERFFRNARTGQCSWTLPLERTSREGENHRS